MSFGPEALRGAPARPAQGDVSYRLARNALLTEFRKGRLSRLDICDAQPELVRNAAGAGQRTTEVCPVCGDADLTHVEYAFGPGLPAKGRLIAAPKDRPKTKDVVFYVVEVCTECRWNHLMRTYLAGR